MYQNHREVTGSQSRARLLDNGQLEIVSNSRVRYRIRPWSEGFGICSVRGASYQSVCLPAFALLTPDLEAVEDSGVQQFLADIPQDVRETLRPFTGFGQATLLHWAASGRAARDLLGSNPRLLWLCAVARYEGYIGKADIPRLFALKQRQILAALLRQEVTNARVKLLHRVRLDTASLSEGRALLALLTDQDEASLLRHAATLPVSLVGLFYRQPDLLQAELIPLLSEWAGQTSLDDFLINSALKGKASVQVAELYRDTLRIAKEAGIEQTGQALGRCHSLGELKGLHDRWLLRLNTSRNIPHVERVFPSPPLPDGRYIKAIRTPEALEAESRKMSHCVRSYAKAVESGECYIYRVLKPERGTLEIRRLPDGSIVPGQFKLAHNKVPSAESWDTVYAWLADCNEWQ